MNDYYVYIHLRGDTHEPFYVGKGREGRAKSIHSRNRHWKFIVAKHGFSYFILKDCMSEHCANVLERISIHRLRALGHKLSNVTEGGDGCRHSSPSMYMPVNCSNGMKFKSVNAASEWAGVNGSKITSVARGRRKTSAGYTWWYEGEPEKSYECHKDRISSARSKMVFRSDGMNYPSLRAAATSVGGSSSNIGLCARGKIQSAYGYGWSHESIPAQPRPRYERAAESLRARSNQ